MISPATVEVRNNVFNAPVLFLAPFGAEELSTVLPVHPDEMPYESAQNAKELAEFSPERLAEGFAALEHVNMFGIYTGSVQPDHFIGTVETKEFYRGTTKEGVMLHHRISQEVGTHVYRSSERGRGFGTLGKYAAMQYALAVDQTHAFTAYTSAENAAAHRSLAKLGFVEQEAAVGTMIQADGRIADLRQWMIMDELAIGTYGDNPELQSKFRPGWERYLSLATSHTVILY